MSKPVILTVDDDPMVSAVIAHDPDAAGFERRGPVRAVGEHADYWWVLIDGAIDLVRHVGREDTVVRTWDVPGHWAGGAAN